MTHPWWGLSVGPSLYSKMYIIRTLYLHWTYTILRFWRQFFALTEWTFMISRETDHVSATTFLFISKNFIIFWIIVFETCFYELFIENIYHLTCSTNGLKGLFWTYIFYNTHSALKDIILRTLNIFSILMKINFIASSMSGNSVIYLC